MEEFTNLVYSRNFISKVICRIDFIRPLTNAQISSSKLQKIVLSHFPIQKMDEILHYNQVKVKVNSTRAAPDVTDERSDVLQRNFCSRTERNTIRISNNYVLLDIQDYTTFTSINNSYSEIITELFSTGNIEIRRIGLRYINEFDFSTMKVQKNYFSPNIAVALDKNLVDSSDAFNLVRYLHKAEYIVEDMQLNFVYGLHNKSYPNIISDNACFMLDFDCYKEEVIDRLEDALRTIRKAHSNIQMMFESSITDNLRRIMDSKNE